MKLSNLNRKVYEYIEQWRIRPLSGKYPHVYVDDVYLKRSWGGEIQNVSILVAMVSMKMDAERSSVPLKA